VALRNQRLAEEGERARLIAERGMGYRFEP
jgi:hypothetical protein